ncbi:MAG: serine hydrolase domain-containing protein, partial [Pseudomonadota bacterium]
MNDTPVPQSALQEILDEYVEKGIPGVSVAIGNEKGVIWTGTSGYSHLQTKTPVDEAHVFGIGSITKVFVAVVILQLSEEGKLDLNATAPEILGDDVLKGIPNTDIATISHMLNHTSGIPSWEDDPKWIAEGRGRDLNVNHIWGKAETLDYVRGPQHKAVNKPGESFSYANTNHTILGLVIEHITKNDVMAEIRQRIYEPLHLDTIYLGGFEPADEKTVPHRYHHATEDFIENAGVAEPFENIRPGLIDATGSNLSVEWVAGGMLSNPKDLVRFATALKNGELLNEDSMAFMKSWTNTGWGETQVGHGIFKSKSGDFTLFGHGGNVLGFTSDMGWHEESGTVMIISTNVGSMHSGDSDNYSNASSFFDDGPEFV